MEPEKRTRVEGYKERLSKLATWQKGPPHPNLEGSIEGIKVAECQSQEKTRPGPFPSPHFCPPCATPGPPGPPLSAPSFLTWLLLLVPGNVCRRVCTMPLGIVSPAQGRGKKPRAGARYGPKPRQTLTSPTSSHTQLLNKIDPLSFQWVWVDRSHSLELLLCPRRRETSLSPMCPYLAHLIWETELHGPELINTFQPFPMPWPYVVWVSCRESSCVPFHLL